MSVPFSKAQGRDAGAPLTTAAAAAAAKSQLVASLRQMQGYLGALQGLASLDVASLGAKSLARTEALLFDSRSMGRSMTQALKHMEAAATVQQPHSQRSKGATVPSGAAPAGEEQQQAARAQAVAQAAATRQVLAALQSAIEKAATLLIAKHRQKEMDERAKPHGADSGGSGSGGAGDKRKHHTGFVTESHVAGHKRVRGGVIAPPPQPPVRDASVVAPLDARVEQALTQVRSLQALQEQLQRNATANAMSPATSGTSTPHKRPQLRSAHTQPHHALATAPLHHLLQDDAHMPDSPSYTEPHSARSDESMSSEADSESAVAQRQQMLAQLVDNVRTLQQRIAAEKARTGASSSDPVDAADSSSSSSQPPAGVPRLDLSALTSQLGALEALLQRSVDTMAQLAALQERDMLKREMRRQILAKGGAVTGTQGQVGSQFGSAPASSFAAKPFGESDTSSPARHRASAASTAAAVQSVLPQQSMADAVAKLSDVPRTAAVVFGSAPRFPEEAGKGAAKHSKVAQRKMLYDKYAALQADLKRAKIAAATDEAAMLDAVRPRLVQNVVMQPDPALAEPKQPRSQAALQAEKERERDAERAKALGPGAYAAESALTQRRVQGVPSWGAGPSAEDDALARTERLVVRPAASGSLGPGSHQVRDDLTTRRVPGPRMQPPASPSAETAQAARARALLAPIQALKDAFEMRKDYENLDATVRRRVPAVGALVPREGLGQEEPTEQQIRKEQVLRDKMKQMQSEFEAREAKLEALAQTRRITQMRVLTSRRAAFLAAEEEKLDRTARLLAAGIGPAASVSSVDAGSLDPHHEYVLPRKSAVRFGAPMVAREMADERTAQGKSARKRSKMQLARQAKHEAEVEETKKRLEEREHDLLTLRSTQSALRMATMSGRPAAPAATDTRDYDAAGAKDFAKGRHVPGDNWARAAPRAIAEESVDPEIDDVVGGREGDVLDLAPRDTLTRPRLRGHAFGPRGGPAAALGLPDAHGLQTLSDTELDYAAGARDDRDDPSVLYPNLDFGRKRQGVGGAIPMRLQVRGGTRSEGEDDDEEFPYLAEGNLPLEVRYGAVEPSVKLGRFAAVRREEFMKLHLAAKAREARKAEAEASKLVLNPHLSRATQRHKPAASMAFSGRHDTGSTADDELDDMEGWGEFREAGAARIRGGPGEYEPRYGFKDPHARASDFGKATGRPQEDEEDAALEGREDHRDFMGGIHASKSGAPKPPALRPGVDFGKSAGRVDQRAEDALDFPDTLGSEGHRLDLNPRSVRPSSSAKALVDMSRSTGRKDVEGPDPLDLELAEGGRLDLNPLKASDLRKVKGGASFARGTGREQGQKDELDILAEQPSGDGVNPRFDIEQPRVPVARFGSSARFVDPADAALDLQEGQQDLDPALADAALRRRAPVAFFGTAAARGGEVSNTAEEAQGHLGLSNPHRMPAHVPGVGFGLSGLPRLPALPQEGEDKDAPHLLLNAPESWKTTQGDAGAHRFGTAARGGPASTGASQPLQLALVLPPGGSTSVGFGSEVRPGNHLVFGNGKAEQSILHPEAGDAYLRKYHPHWGFDQAARFGAEDVPLQTELQVDEARRRALDPKSPSALMAPHDRFGASASADAARAQEQLLALTPSDALVRASHPRAFVGSEARFPADLSPRRQLNLYPNLDAVRPNTPSASLAMSSRTSDAARAGLDEASLVGPRSVLHPNPAATLPKSPAASLTSAARPSPGAPPPYNTSLRLRPDFDSQHPRGPEYSIVDRPMDPGYVPSNAEMAKWRKERQREERKEAAAAAAAAARASKKGTEGEDEEAALVAALNEPSEFPSPRLTRVLGPSPSRSKRFPGAGDDLADLADSAAALSLDASSELGSASGSFNLPSAGVVGHTASLVRARREQQAREQAREERRRARQEQTQRPPQAAPASRVPPTSFQHNDPAPAASLSSAPPAVALLDDSSSDADAPPRRTVQFAAHPEVRLYEKPGPAEGVRAAPTSTSTAPRRKITQQRVAPKVTR